MVDCLAGCASRFGCGISSIRRPLEGAVLAPFVEISVNDGRENVITVGNKSSPQFGNHAVVKSMQYGQTNGTGITIEIVDEEGGAFVKFYEKIVSCMETARSKYQIKAKWGWLEEDCPPSSSSRRKESVLHTFMLKRVAGSVENGTFKFVLEGNDIANVTQETRGECIFGSDDNPMPLKQAIVQLFQNWTPRVDSVKFLRPTPSGGTTPWNFEGDPRSVWRAEQKNPMTAALEWIRPYRTDAGKGIFPAWNDTASVPEIIFWEDYNPACDENVEVCGRSKGTFIVNGGRCSNVISFKPKYTWYWGSIGNTGGIINEGKAKGEKQGDEQDCRLRANESKDAGPSEEGCAKGGLQTENQTPTDAMQTYGTAEATTEVIKSDQQHQRANRNFMYMPIEAELTIQGDPVKFDRPPDLVNKTVAIVYINPFHVVGGGETGCGDWLRISQCNDVFSNQGWIILGVNHDIREGNYTTTLKLKLPAPGADVAASLPLGANASGFPSPCDR